MDEAKKEAESESSPTGVFELQGEPAIVINGVPDVSSPSDGTLVLSSAVIDTESAGNADLDAGFLGNRGFGEWFEGREVRKMFGDQYFTGTVTRFDPETGWYTVEYEDGDTEDVDQQEVENIIVPLDISVPIKTLALKVAKRGQKNIPTSGKGATRSQSSKSKKAAIEQVKNV